MSTSVPFEARYQLDCSILDTACAEKNGQTEIEATAEPSSAPALPGHPRISMRHDDVLYSFLRRDLYADDLEKLASHLWLMSTQSSANVSPLHHQRVKGRNIVITESPRLHLVWYYDRIYVKPLPTYLLNHDFWSNYLCNLLVPFDGDRAGILKSTRGFVRTYTHLCQHESDFAIAQELRLVPRDCTWTSFSNFIAGFAFFDEEEVSKRYHYGELRLTRLNFWSKIFLHRFHYEQLHGQYGAYFVSFYGPWLVAFAIISVVLSAMQLEVGAEQTSAGFVQSNMLPEWPAFAYACRWFSVASLSLVVAAFSTYGLILCYMLLDEIVWTSSMYLKKTALRGA
ncbi:MAG: hypothetical protein M1828_002653 [Chrysothrix sp. TS-e1954]|nr:MAG: hypothetical protein M1828_002653 [Chrysothrix sp. TS-e1954]